MQQRLDEAKMQKSMWTMLMGKPLDLKNKQMQENMDLNFLLIHLIIMEKNEKC